MNDTEGHPASVASANPLLELARRYSSLDDADQILDLLLHRAMERSGADHGVVLERAALDRLVVVADHGSALPGQMSIGDVRATVWGVLLGRTTLRWVRYDAAPRPFRQMAGWEQGLVVRIAARQGPTKLLAVGGRQLRDNVDIDLIQGMADIAAPAIENLDLIKATRQTRALLRGVTDLAGRLGAAISPEELWTAITTSLDALEGIIGAGVWGAGPGGDGTALLVAGHIGDAAESGQVRGRLRRMFDPATPAPVRSLVATASRAHPTGPLVTLVALSTRPPHVLGIVHEHPLDDLSQGVLASLAGAAEPAMRQVQMAAERRALLSGYTRSLRPSTGITELDIGVEHHPNTNTPGSFGGDFYDWFQTADHRCLVALGDVSGKGITAAGAASMLVWSLRALGGPGADLTRLSAMLDEVVARELDLDRFVTLALLSLDTQGWTAELLLAGHPAPMLVQRGRASVVTCEAAPPLGVNIGSPPPQPTLVTLRAGDALVLFTDGVTDAQNAEGVRYGTRRLSQHAASAAVDTGWTAQSMAAALWKSVHAWAGGPPDDDCAIVVVRRPG